MSAHSSCKFFRSYGRWHRVARTFAVSRATILKDRTLRAVLETASTAHVAAFIFQAVSTSMSPVRSSTSFGSLANHIWYSATSHMKAKQAAMSMPAKISTQAKGW